MRCITIAAAVSVALLLQGASEPRQDAKAPAATDPSGGASLNQAVRATTLLETDRRPVLQAQRAIRPRPGRIRSSDEAPPLRLRPPGVVVQRMVANVGKRTLDKLNKDWASLSTLSFALQESGDGQIVEEWAAAPYDKIGKSERLYLLGHGSKGKVGSLAGGDLIQFAKTLKARLPKGYSGDIVSLNCHSGGEPDPSSLETQSGIEQLALALGLPGVELYGPQGKSYHHPDLDEPRAFDPKQDGVDRGGYDDAKKAVKTAWLAKQTEMKGMSLKERAHEARVISAKFYKDWVAEFGMNQWLLPEGWLKVVLEP